MKPLALISWDRGHTIIFIGDNIPISMNFHTQKRGNKVYVLRCPSQNW